MGRSVTGLGHYGDIGTKENLKTGRWRAWASFRDASGRRIPVDGYGTTESKAKADLRRKLAEKSQQAQVRRGSRLTLDSRFSTAIDMWIQERESDESISEQTLDGYKKAIEASDDKRASKETIKIRPSLGELTIREVMDTQTLDNYLKSITDLGHKKKANVHRIVLKGVVSLVVRKCGLKWNPMDDIDRSAMRRGRREKPQAAAWETLQGLREQIARWADGYEVPGTPGRAAETGGRPRDHRLLDVADLLAATGVRPWEVLAFRWQDVENYDRDRGVIDPNRPVRLTICGTIVYVTGKPLFRQEWPKTSSGYRTVILPDYAVDALRHARKYWTPNDLDLILPSHNGKIWNPNNFGRAWRNARGDTSAGSEYGWITMRTYRKTVLTAIKLAGGDARGQAGHSDDRVVDQYYFDKPIDVGDHRETLQAYRAS